MFIDPDLIGIFIAILLIVIIPGTFITSAILSDESIHDWLPDMIPVVAVFVIPGIFVVCCMLDDDGYSDSL